MGKLKESSQAPVFTQAQIENDIAPALPEIDNLNNSTENCTINQRLMSQPDSSLLEVHGIKWKKDQPFFR